MATVTDICPVCEEGELQPRIGSLSIDYRGQQITVDGIEYCSCDACGADPVLATQTRRNDARIADAKRRHDGLLTGSEIAAIRKRLGLRQSDAAIIFGGGERAFSKYERGEILQSVAMDRLLRVADSFPWMLEFLSLHAGLGADFDNDSDSEYIGSLRTQIRAANQPAYTLPGKDDIHSLDGESEDWRSAA